MRRMAAAFLVVLAAAVGCGASLASRSPPPPPSAPSASIPPSASEANGREIAEPEYVVLVTDPAALEAVEAHGASLYELLDGSSSPGPRYLSMVKSIEGDVAAARAADPASGPGIGFSHRLFDVRKLTSSEAKFELIGISNRLDRMHVDPSACGEVRFVYRLTYATTRSGVAIASRLPATLAVSFWSRPKGSSGDCSAVVDRWKKRADADMATWLPGVVGPTDALRSRFKSVEANLQLVRWPSTVRPDLGGHAEYLLRAFVDRNGALVPGPLENTPDVARLERDPALRAKLVRWLGDESNLARLDRGTAIVPDEFLATKAISVSPRGLARRANRPFRRLFEPAALAGVDAKPATRQTIGTPSALVRRLDELSCPGCHQSRSVAGFHLLGEDATTGANAIAVAMSPHLAVEVVRRRRRDAIAPFAERGDDEAGRYGAHCSLGNPENSAFAKWTCASGLRCTPDDSNPDDAAIGVCLPSAPSVGDPCEAGVISATADAHADRVTKVNARACAAAAACETNRVGFPGGMCQAACDSKSADAVCAGIPVLLGFNACLGKKVPFERCIAENTTPGAVRACDASTPCRDDYVCARTAAGGACMPPYFLFQLRVDGHP